LGQHRGDATARRWPASSGYEDRRHRRQIGGGWPQANWSQGPPSDPLGASSDGPPRPPTRRAGRRPASTGEERPGRPGSLRRAAQVPVTPRLTISRCPHRGQRLLRLALVQSQALQPPLCLFHVETNARLLRAAIRRWSEAAVVVERRGPQALRGGRPLQKTARHFSSVEFCFFCDVGPAWQWSSPLAP